MHQKSFSDRTPLGPGSYSVAPDSLAGFMEWVEGTGEGKGGLEKEGEGGQERGKGRGVKEGKEEEGGIEGREQGNGWGGRPHSYF